MIGSLLNDPRVATLQRALNGLARRQQALASNIANVDTPGYTRRDVSFETELQARSGGGRLATTSAGHLASAGTGEGGVLRAVMTASGHSTSARNDGNDVDIDYEMTRAAETSLRYQVLSQVTTTRFATLRDLISRAV